MLKTLQCKFVWAFLPFRKYLTPLVKKNYKLVSFMVKFF